MHRNSDDQNNNRPKPQRRNRIGVRIATLGLSLAVLGGGAALATQPVNAASQPKKVTVADGTTTARPSTPMPSFAGWGG